MINIESIVNAIRFYEKETTPVEINEWLYKPYAKIIEILGN